MTDTPQTLRRTIALDDLKAGADMEKQRVLAESGEAAEGEIWVNITPVGRHLQVCFQLIEYMGPGQGYRLFGERTAYELRPL